MSRLTNIQIEDIIKKYQNGITPLEISKEYGIYNNSVTRLLRKHGIDRNQLERVSSENIQYIIEKYVSGTSSEEIAKDLSICGSTVCRILKRNNIDIRPAEQNKRIYNIKQDYFSEINNEEKAYFLGLLFADGNVSVKFNDIKLGLHPKDVDILNKFSKSIYGFEKVHKDIHHQDDGSTMEYLYVVVSCKKMKQDLIKLGCGPQKTFNIEFPINIIDNSLLRHFIRGYFDGDGCLSISNKSRPVVDITSNEKFMQGFLQYIHSVLVLPFNKLGQRHKDTDTRNIQFAGFNNVKIFLDYIYDSATIFMQRKHNLYLDFLKLFQQKGGNIDPNNYGTNYIPKYNETALTSENLKLINDKTPIINYLFDFYRDNGYPYPIINNDSLIKDFSTLRATNVNSIVNDKILKLYNCAGLSIFKHFSPHFQEVKSGLTYDRPSMLEAFNNDDLLLKTIKNRVDGNFNMTGNMLRQGLVNSYSAFKGSSFFPIVAKFIYDKFTKENSIIYDYSMGFGQRLIGALSLPHKLTYIGVDPCEKSVESNQNIFNFFNKNIPLLNKEAEFVCCGSEEYCDAKYIGKIDLAFSSPPYYNQEVYEENDKQAYFNKDYNYFINNWWKSTVKNIYDLLKSDGVFILNVKDNMDGFLLAQDMINIANLAGFLHIDTYQLQLSKNLVFKNNSGSHKYESIYVFKKQSINKEEK